MYGGWRLGVLRATTSSNPSASSAPIARSGYYFVGSDGGIYNYGAGGSAPFLGSMGGSKTELARRGHGHHAGR